jgi:hypothetical protein
MKADMCDFTGKKKGHRPIEPANFRYNLRVLLIASFDAGDYFRKVTSQGV